MEIGGVKKTQGTDYDHDVGKKTITVKAPYPPNGTPIKICYQYIP